MPNKNKKVPLRKCVITQEMKPKKELIRIVRNKDGEVFVDQTGKKNGRGAYVSRDTAVVEKAQKSKALDRHLNANIQESIYEELKLVIEGKNIE
ncbi:YlxR family protein [Aquibacillus koreensis]|uniref:YlxR family protein n=1 Tax=Aquibacillus koreensis TaxID=279446 RepID=A0A9X3WN77_9BACI|nr:YlxR family protein [Aquibacillus koreensis]MCT2534563.1 YlxR family protein [Aquibacillus koreensis]MDC3421843.1 YlxR family protein [Aquibacillus koreensis]